MAHKSSSEFRYLILIIRITVCLAMLEVSVYLRMLLPPQEFNSNVSLGICVIMTSVGLNDNDLLPKHPYHRVQSSS
jgi:hypothetical protein